MNRFAAANGQPSQPCSETSIHGTYQALAAARTTAETRNGRCGTSSGYASPKARAARAMGADGAISDIGVSHRHGGRRT